MKDSHICNTVEETLALGAAMGGLLRGGEVFALVGELGAGKTTFVRGLAEGLRSSSSVTSPTFNLVHRYEGRIPLFHYDLYRLKKLEEIEALDLDANLESGGVVVIEWPQIVKSILPRDRTRWVEFVEDGAARRLTIRDSRLTD